MMSFLRDVRRVLGMACREHTELLSRQLEEPLTRGESVGLWLHVLICAGCRAFRRQIRRIRAVGGELGRQLEGGAGMPEGAKERLRARLDGRAKS